MDGTDPDARLLSPVDLQSWIQRHTWFCVLCSNDACPGEDNQDPLQAEVGTTLSRGESSNEETTKQEMQHGVDREADQDPARGPGQHANHQVLRVGGTSCLSLLFPHCLVESGTVYETGR